MCSNAHLANDIVHFWLQQGILAAFADVTQIMREKTYGKSRFDFLLQRGGKRCYAEVKSVNLLGMVTQLDFPTRLRPEAASIYRN